MRTFVLLIAYLISTGICVAEQQFEQSAVFDPNPRHLWNEIYGMLHTRPVAGVPSHDPLDPLLLCGSQYLSSGESLERFDALLDRFAREHGESQITENSRRAFMQHDLWTVFDWLYRGCSNASYTGEGYVLSEPREPSERNYQIMAKLVTAIRALALTEGEIAALPDNYLPLKTKLGSSSLPHIELNTLDREWLYLGRSGAPIAASHTLARDGRNVFFELIRVPGGSELVFKTPPHEEPRLVPTGQALPIGTRAVLVRRKILLSKEGDMILSPITESIQARTFTLLKEEPELYEITPLRYFVDPLNSLTKIGDERTEIQSLALSIVKREPRPNEVSTIGKLQSCTMCHQGASRETNALFAISRPRGFGATGWDEPVTKLTKSNPNWTFEVVRKWKRHDSSFGFLSALWLNGI